MRIITKRRILAYAKQQPNAAASLTAWISVVFAARWQSITAHHDPCRFHRNH
jgi:mRNA-degrading endonuclease HigB of HigAB toxin-antitoxin module